MFRLVVVAALLATSGETSAQTPSLCSAAETKELLTQLAQRGMHDFLNARRLTPTLANAVLSGSPIRYDISLVRNLGPIGGSGGAHCAARVTASISGGEPAELTADYTVELTEDGKSVVRASFALNR